MSDNGKKVGYECHECNCRMTLEEFTSKKHADLHIGEWANGTTILEEEIIAERKTSSQYNTLENIIAEPRRRRKCK